MSKRNKTSQSSRDHVQRQLIILKVAMKVLYFIMLLGFSHAYGWVTPDQYKAAKRISETSIG